MRRETGKMELGKSGVTYPDGEICHPHPLNNLVGVGRYKSTHMLLYVFLILGFIFLIKGADFLVMGSSSLAKRMGISDLVIGLTVVAFGTSTPEMIVNVIASLEGSSGVVIGNIIGSNIFNILLILGIASIIHPLSVTERTVGKEIPFSLLAAFMVGILVNDHFFGRQNQFQLSRADGFILLIFFILFICYIIKIIKKAYGVKVVRSEKSKIPGVDILKITGGLFCLIVGGKLVVMAAIDIAHRAGVSESLIGFTVVAAGTSLPELATSAVAAYKKNSDIAVGNIVGSNIFNIFFILGISVVINPLTTSIQLNFDIFVLIVSSLLLFLFMFTGKRRTIERWEGFSFVLLYIIYLVFLIKKG